MKFKVRYGPDPITNRIAIAVRLLVVVVAVAFLVSRQCAPQDPARTSPSSQLILAPAPTLAASSAPSPTVSAPR